MRGVGTGTAWKLIRDGRCQRLDDIAAWPDKIGAVAPAEVQAAARAILVERNSATGILLPERTS